MRFGVTVPNLGAPVELFNGTGDTVLGVEGEDSVCVWFAACWLKKKNNQKFTTAYIVQATKRRNSKQKIQNFW